MPRVASLRRASGGMLFACTLAATASLAAPFEPVPPPAAGRSSQPEKAMRGADLLAELRKGGYVIYFRHTSTDFSRDDRRSRSDDDCDNQRPLTDQGREEARAIGAAMRGLGIPLGPILASPRCRTTETAMLAFGRAEKTSAVRGGPRTDPDRYYALRKIFLTPVPPGANVVIASHGNPFYAVAGAPYLAEGEAAVVRAGTSDFEVVARIRHDAWRELVGGEQ
jgi:phosphohistidine phosphatase SixA